MQQRQRTWPCRQSRPDASLAMIGGLQHRTRLPRLRLWQIAICLLLATMCSGAGICMPSLLHRCARGDSASAFSLGFVAAPAGFALEDKCTPPLASAADSSYILARHALGDRADVQRYALTHRGRASWRRFPFGCRSPWLASGRGTSEGDTFSHGELREAPSWGRAAPPRQNEDKEWRVSLPKDMAKYRDLEPFMIVLEDALLEESRGRGPPTGVSCVAAMNHLKRLWGFQKGKPGAGDLQLRYRKLFLYFLSRAEPTVSKLRLKHLSVLLNAIISQRWIDADRRRYTRKLCEDAVKQVLLEITAATDGAFASENRQAALDARRERGEDAFSVFKQAVATTAAASGYPARAGGDHTDNSQTRLVLSEDEATSIHARYGGQRKVPKYIKNSYATKTLGRGDFGVTGGGAQGGGVAPQSSTGARDARSYVVQAIRQEHGINQGTLAILSNSLARGGFSDDKSWQTLTELIIDSCRLGVE